MGAKRGETVCFPCSKFVPSTAQLGAQQIFSVRALDASPQTGYIAFYSQRWKYVLEMEFYNYRFLIALKTFIWATGLLTSVVLLRNFQLYFFLGSSKVAKVTINQRELT